MMDETKDLVPNWLIHSPDPNVSVGHLCTPLRLKWLLEDIYQVMLLDNIKKESEICGVEMPDGMKENDKFPEPIITPATKAESGNHDEDISKEEIINRRIVSIEDYEILEKYTKFSLKKGLK